MTRYEVVVDVSHRAGIADPEGSTIERALPQLGFEGVADVTVGKRIRFMLEAADPDEAQRRVQDMCARFLANPVIEDTEITISEPATA